MAKGVSGLKRLWAAIEGQRWTWNRPGRDPGNRAAAASASTSGMASAMGVLEILEPRVFLSTVPNDPLADLDLRNTNVSLPAAWDITTGQTDAQIVAGQKEIVVAVLDTGLDVNHEDLAGNIFTNTGEVPNNGLDDDGNGYIDDTTGWDFADHDNDVKDFAGHGTFVSGIIGSVGNNGIGTAGVNWNIKILPVKVFPDPVDAFPNPPIIGGATDFDIAAGISYITDLKHRGVNIVAINASLGGASFPFPEVLTTAIRQAGEAGILFVAAAGNDGNNVDTSFDTPSKISLALPNVITVAATDSNDQIASFSNIGFSAVEVTAPGVDITSTYPTYIEPGQDGLDNDSDGFTDEPDEVDDDGLPEGYETASGTSFSAPMVTGLIALEKAANPLATPAQLKDAVIKGVDVLSQLDPLYSFPPFVGTSGRINAYKSLQVIRNLFVHSDVATSGNWIGPYGSQGAVVVGNAETFPSFVNASVSNFSERILGGVTNKKTNALRTVDGTSRIVGYWESADTLSISLNFTDGQTHRVSLYGVDFDKKGRSQTVQIIDPLTGFAIDSQTMSNFTNGQYLTWDLSGNVEIRVTKTAGPSAVVSGVFFDSIPTNAAIFGGTDETTKGTWGTKLGTEYAFVVGETSPISGVATIGTTNATQQRFKSGAKGLLQRGALTTSTARGYLSSDTSMDVSITFNDLRSHRVSAYFVDADKKKRSQRVEVIDPSTGAVLDTRLVNSFDKGKYLSWDLGGDVTSPIVILRITNLGSKSAVLSGLFFDVPPTQPGYFAGIDSTTHGNWFGRYGFDDHFIYGEDTDFPGFVDVINPEGFVETIDPNSSADRALVRESFLGVDSKNDRIVAHVATNNAMNFDMNFTDGRLHRVSFYAVDDPKGNRVQAFQYIDVTTGQIINTVVIDKFKDGKYVTFDLSGHVQIRVTALDGPDAVVNGIFFD